MHIAVLLACLRGVVCKGAHDLTTAFALQHAWPMLPRQIWHTPPSPSFSASCFVLYPFVSIDGQAQTPAVNCLKP
eukprot:221296-Pelagomonas_calceolata.AAC.4